MTTFDSTSPFQKFWRALNEHLSSCALPELTFGPAHRLWERAVSDAGHEARAMIESAGQSHANPQ